MSSHARYWLASLASYLALVLPLFASDTIRLWPGGAPGEKGNIGKEMDMTTPKDALFEGKPVLRLGNISDPTVTLWRAPVSKDTHSLVVVCPGGGYEILAMDLEGTEICQWLNTIGVNAALLKYRVPVRNGWQRHTAPLQDVQRALGLVRFHAADWNVDPNRIGVMGFSAGGHLAALASTRFGQRGYEPQDEADRTSCRPDFAMVIYPAYLLAGAGPELAPEITVTSNTTPTFLVQTEDDPLQVETSLFYYLALKRAQVPVEMHLFASGGHAYGVRKTDGPAGTWTRRAEEWLQSRRVLRPENFGANKTASILMVH